jgi:ATP-binding cassette subfamily B protein
MSGENNKIGQKSAFSSKSKVTFPKPEVLGKPLGSKREIVRSTLRFFAMVVKAGKSLIPIHLLIQVVCGLFPAVMALVWQKILMFAESGIPREKTYFYFLSLAIIGGLSFSYIYFIEIADTILRNRISLGFQKNIHNKANALPMHNYESPVLNDLLSRAAKIFCYGNALGFMLMVFYLFQQIVTIFSMTVILWGFYPLLTISAVFLLLPSLVKFRLVKAKLIHDLQLSPLRREADVYQDYVTRYEYIKEIRSMDAGPFFINKWRNVKKRIINEEKVSQFRLSTVHALMDILERGATVASYLLCIYLVLNNRISVAEFGAVIVMTGRFLESYASLMRRIKDFHEESLSTHSALKYFDLPVESREKQLPLSIHSIALNHVSYTYPEAENAAVQDINFSLKSGETVAVIGKNGSGKTTLSKLVMGLIDPTSGTVTINDIPAREIEYSSLYQYTTTVFQDYLCYNMSLKDNITISASGIKAEDAEITRLLKDLKITFVGQSPGVDLQTELGVEHGGTNLSGGQWQQLAIARAAYKNAKIVVLDEPTSALDPIREAELYDTFRNLCGKRIGLLITHRLGLCVYADRILVMDEGKISEYGTHDELMRNDGLYKRMYLEQQKLYIK